MRNVNADEDAFLLFHLRAVQIGVLATLLVLLNGLIFMLLYGAEQGIPPVAFGAVLFAGSAGATVVVRLPWKRLLQTGRGMLVFHAWSIGNIVLISAAIALTGGPRSDLFIVYSLTTVFFAAIFPRRDQLALLALTIVSYLFVAQLHGWDIAASSLLIRMGFLGILAFLGSFLARELKQQMYAHRDLALHDPLTGLANRTLFRDRARQAVLDAKRSGMMASVVILDLDGFKEVNDTLGHPTGDDLLKQIAERLDGGTLRDTDTIARLGGDEFGIVLKNVGDRAQVLTPVQRVIDVMKPPFTVQGLSLEMRASIGVAVFPDDGDSVDLLIQRADVAMYMSKEMQTPFEVYDSSGDHHSAEQLSLVSDLRKAIDTDQITVHYQPKVRLGSEEIVGVEALARWNHPEFGAIPPDHFVRLAESGGFIGRLTRKVLASALEQCHRWEQQGHILTMAVNLSVRDLRDRTFPDDLRKMLSRWKIPPARLVLEITENGLMAESHETIAVLEELRQLGIRFALDDFGTGFASLGRLARLPVDQIKIDKSFVIRMESDEKDAAIVKSTIDLARHLSLEVVAEGVETNEAYRRLQGFGCHLAQGFLLSRPVPADELELDQPLRHRSTNS